MSDLTLVASVTRANLPTPLAELDINDLVNYSVGRNLDVSSVTWKKMAVQSPYVHGRIPVHEIKDASESTLVVYVMGTSHATVEANLGTLLTAFTEQYSYQLKLLVEGVQHTWECERADYQIGYITETLLAFRMPVSLSFHRSPIPVAGAF